MTNPTPPPPHQDSTRQDDVTRVTIMEYVTTVINALDRRFDTLHADLKDDINHRFADADLRYQQRFDQQQIALNAALSAQKEAVATALTAAEKATTKAETASDKRFECVSADTLIGDTPAGQIQSGDKIPDFDGITTVVSNYIDTEELFEVQTNDGAVRCTATHPWYARPNADSEYQWIQTQHLSPGWIVWRV